MKTIAHRFGKTRMDLSLPMQKKLINEKMKTQKLTADMRYGIITLMTRQQ